MAAGRAAAELATGDIAQARDDVQAALRSAQDLELGLLEVECLCLLGAVEWAEGDYRAAAAAGSAGVAAAARTGWERSTWAIGACAVEAHAALMRARPVQALHAADQGLNAARPGLDPMVRFALRAARGGALCDTGEPRAALLELQQARAELGGAELPDQLAVSEALLEHRSALLSGHPTAAAAALCWLADRGVGLAEQELMRAWTELAAEEYRAARTFVAPLLAGDGRPALASTEVEAAVLEATAALRDGDRSAARHALRIALTRAEALDAVRPFALAGRDVHALMIDQLGDVENPGDFAHRALTDGRRWQPAPAAHLSARELDVLRRLPSLRNLDEIAGDLTVSVNTVKSHLRAIYRKLGVSSRRTAVLAASEHGLLTHDRD